MPGPLRYAVHKLLGIGNPPGEPVVLPTLTVTREGVLIEGRVWTWQQLEEARQAVLRFDHDRIPKGGD